MTPNLWLAAEVQSGRASKLVMKKKHQPSTVPGMDSAPASIQERSPEMAPLPPGCKRSGGDSAAANQGGKAVPVTCDHQHWLRMEGWAQHFTLLSCCQGQVQAEQGHPDSPGSYCLCCPQLPQHGCPSTHSCLLGHGRLVWQLREVLVALPQQHRPSAALRECKAACGLQDLEQHTCLPLEREAR